MKEKIQEFFLQNRVFLIFLLIWILLFLGLRTAQHYSFGTNAFDLSISDYMISYTLKGELMPEPFHGYWGSHFAYHFTPILFLLVPFYLLFKGPLFLLYIQVLGGASSTLILYVIAKKIFPIKYIPSLIAITYLLYRPFLNGLMYDFHYEMLFPLFLFLSYYFAVIEKRMHLYFVFMILALFIKEDISIFIFFFGIFLFIKIKDDRKIGLITSSFALIYFVLVMEIVIPHFRSQLGIAGKFEYFGLWGELGDNIFEVIKNFIFKSPSIFTSLPFEKIGISLFNIFSALLFIPFLSSFILLAIPPIVILGSSTSPIMHGFGLHYIANILPFLFLAFIFGLKNFRRLIIKWKKPTKILVYLCLIIFFINLINTKWELLRFSRYADLKDYKIVKSAIDLIPRNASVASLSAIIPHIPKRKNIHMLPEINDAEYILIHTGVNLWPFKNEEFENFMDELSNQIEWECIKECGKIKLFQRQIINNSNSNFL